MHLYLHIVPFKIFRDTRRIAGLLYADSKIPGKIGAVEEVVINSIALHAGLALENAYLFEMASLDGLTRLFQRHYSSAAAEIEWKRANRRQHPLSILMIDVDNFKMINDTRGHDYGDSVLRTIAATLRKICRLEDVISRYGGDEFMILLPETASDGAVLLAERIRKTFETRSEFGRREICDSKYRYCFVSNFTGATLRI